MQMGVQRRFDFGEENPQDRVDQPGIMVEKIAQAFRLYKTNEDRPR
jgi:hypothetical protein